MAPHTFQPTAEQTAAVLAVLATHQAMYLGDLARAAGLERGADAILMRLCNQGIIRRWRKSSWNGQGFEITDAGREMLVEATS